MARCELALTDGPLVVSPAWTTVGRLISAKIRRGRRANEGADQPGTADVTLDDPTRALDPTNPGSAWAASLTPMRQMRVVQTLADASTEVLFRGHVAEYSTVWRPTTETTLACVDRLGYFGTRRLADTTSYKAAVLADSPLSYYRLGEATGSKVALDSSPAGRHHTQMRAGIPIGSLVRRWPGAVIADPDAAASLEKGSLWLSPSALPPAGSTTFTLEFWVRKEGDSALQLIHIFPTSVGNTSINILEDGRLRVSQSTGATLTTAVSIIDGEWHHVVWKSTASNVTNTISVDGTVVSGNLNACTISAALSHGISVGPYDVDEWTWYTSLLSTARIAEHYRIARGRWGGAIGHRSGTRINLCLTDLLGVTGSSVAAGVEDVATPGAGGGAEKILSDSAASHLYAVAAVEDGRLYATRAGVITFAARPLLAPAPVAAYANDGTGLRFVHGQPSRRRADIVNHAEVARDGGPAQVVESAASVAAYMRHDASSRTGAYVDDAAAYAAAGRAVRKGKDPVTRIDQLVVNARIGAAEEASVAVRELGDVVSVRLTPPSGSPLDMTCVVEGMSHDIDTGRRWSTTYDLSPLIVPQTPAVSAYAAPDQAVTGTFARITPAHEHYDTANFHTPMLPASLTVPVAGDYLIVATAQFTATSAGELLAAVVVNGTSRALSSFLHNSGNSTLACAPTVYRLVAGDVIEMWAIQTSGGAAAALFYDAYSPVLSAVRLG